jgi:hypothetical protein
MSLVTVQSAEIEGFAIPENPDLAEVECRLYCSTSFLPNGQDAPVSAGSPTNPSDGSAFHKKFTAALANNNLTLPQITIDATDDGLPATARYSLYFVRRRADAPAANLGTVQPFPGFQNLAVPASPNTTTWAALFNLNNGGPPPLPVPVPIKGYPLTLEINTTTVGTVGGGPDNLHSYTLPAGSLAANGDRVKARYSGKMGNNDNNKQIIGKFGGTTYTQMALSDLDSATLGWNLEAEIVRLSSSSVRVSYTLICNLLGVDGANSPNTLTNGFYAESSDFDVTSLPDLGSNDTVMLVQGNGTADNDVTQKYSSIELIQR